MEGEAFRKVRISPELMTQWASRDSYGNRVYVDWGEPDSEGFYEPVFSVHLDENIVADELRSLQVEIDALKQPVLGLKGGIARMDVEQLITARIRLRR